MKIASRILVIILSLALYGCSVNVAGPDVSSTAPPTVLGPPILATSLHGSATVSPQTSISPASPMMATSVPGLGTVEPQTAAPPAAPLTAQIPATWANLKVAGKMVFSSADMQQDNPILRIQVLDLATGDISTVFQTTGVAWIYYMTVSPVTSQVVMSYAPPPGYNSPGQQALYSLPLDGSQPPQVLLPPPTADDEYLQVEWSPDGKYIYYVHSNDKPQTAGQVYPLYEIFRMAYPSGQPEKIADHAFWPRLSADSSQLVYISSDPQDGKNRIFLAEADGSNAHQVDLTGPVIPDIIDAPIFSPDGKHLLYSSPSPTAAYQPNWFEKLMGIQVAEAHTVPSDWWSVPLGGGTPKQLTHIQSPVLFASVSPDGNYIASYSGNGLFVMKPDGTGLTIIIPDLGGMAGMVNWLH